MDTESSSCSSGASTPWINNVYANSSQPSLHSTNYSAAITDDDVAIVGMSCRTAGGINSPEQLWDFLLNKGNASCENPSWRWEPWIKRDPRNAEVIGKTISKGYFIKDLENFDAAFFGISPKEAEQMDPHQRLGLEVTWQALENAGIDPKSLAGSDTAVFMGVDSDDYSRLLLEDLPNIEAWMGIGSTAHGIPNRISYHLDLMGPSVAVDAACASSLAAVHDGRRAILAGSSSVAIVGGVNVCLSPALFRMLGVAGALSPDGECLSFDDNAHGYARGEGAAVLILKRLSSALVDGDRILATIKGSAVAHDGKTNGIMAPNAKAQELVARKALSAAGINPSTVGYIEAHATSTTIGDPTEVSAISAVYGASRPSDAPAAIGSIKPNIGHLEAAAGAISLIKSVLAVHKGQLAPQTNLNKLNSRVDWEKSGLYVVRDIEKWTEHDRPRRAAVSSYGYGGTVSHAVIEQNLTNFPRASQDDSGPTLLVLSAPQEKRLAIQSATHAEWLSSSIGQSEDLQAIATTLSQRRARHAFRAAFVVSNHEEASQAFDAFTTGAAGDWTAQGRVFGSHVNTGAVWVFSGHGAQWADMGKELLQHPKFHETLAALDTIVHQELGYSAIEQLLKGDFSASSEIQILTYLVQIGLSELLMSKGARPQAIIGHSVGEIAAAVVAGCLTPEEGTFVVVRRARLYTIVEGLGGMYLVSRTFAAVAAELGDRKDVVAAINSSPSSCVISGTSAALTEYVETLKERGCRVFKVQTDIAFHSPLLNTLAEPLKEALSGMLHPQRAIKMLYSTSQIDARSDALRDVDYWINNMISPVDLTSAVGAAVDDGFRTFLEVSTHPIVLHSINDIIVEKGVDDFVVIPTMKKNQPAEKCVIHAIGQLHVKGSPVDFAALTGHSWSTEVPGFQWSHKPFWKEVSFGAMSAGKVHNAEKHSLLGQRTLVAGSDTTLFTTKVDKSNKPFPQAHELSGVEIVPAAVYVNTIRQASGAGVLAEVSMRIPLVITDDFRDVQVVVQDNEVKVASHPSSLDDDTWITHCSARCLDEQFPAESPVLDTVAIKKRIGVRLSNTYSIDHLAKTGVAGMAFPWVVTEHYGKDKEMIVRIESDPDNEKVSWDPLSWAPILDAASSVGSTIFALASQYDLAMRIISKIGKAKFYSNDPAPKSFYLYITESEIAPNDSWSRSANVSILDHDGRVLIELQSLTLTDVNRNVSESDESMSGLVHQMAWIPAPLSEKPLSLKHIVLICPKSKVLERYKQELEHRGANVRTISSADELVRGDLNEILQERSVIIAYCPGSVQNFDDVPSSAHAFIWEVRTAVKDIVTNALSAKFFVITNQVYAAESATAVAQGPLIGLARVVAGEHSDIWGGLIDNEGPEFPIMAIKYAQGQEVIRFIDGVARMTRLRPFTASQRLPSSSAQTLLPKPHGVYVITGGLGSLGLETCDFLIEKGARRIVLVSRRSLPPRRSWSNAPPELAPVVKRIQAMEQHGASIYTIPLDIGAPDAHIQLEQALDQLSIPPVLGVMHASGVLEDSLLVETSSDSFARVLSPKISGAMALHKAFPPGTLDFFILYSSIGEVVGTSGQSSYASGNSFLDVLAAHRRKQGDNAIAFQWTAWRGLGMATATEFLAIELRSKGITDISRDEGFRAWEHLSKYDTDHAVVTRTLTYDEGEAVPYAMLEEVVGRRPHAVSTGAITEKANNDSARPTNPSELRGWLDTKIRECIASVVKIDDIDEIDPRSALADMGIDSVMTIALRSKLQSVFKMKIPQTLTWNHPTTAAMVEWFWEQLEVDLSTIRAMSTYPDHI